MEETVSGWKRLSNGGVIESKIWLMVISSNRAVFSISTASTEEYLWCMAVYQKFSSMEKGIQWWGGVGEESRKQQRGWLEYLRKRSWEHSKIAAWNWCHHDIKKRYWHSASRDLLRRESVMKLKKQLPRMLLTQTCWFPLALTLPFASLSGPYAFRFHVIADVAMGFCEVTRVCARICREGKVTNHKERQHVSVSL